MSVEKKRKSTLLSTILRRGDYQLYLLLLPTIIYFVIFHYGPMYGLQIAFKDFIAAKGIWGSPWIGFEHFRRFFRSYQFSKVLRNTVGLSFYQLFAGFPVPIILALLLNQLVSRQYRKLVQTVTYAPHFISVVVLAGMLTLFLSPSSGVVNHVIRMISGKSVFFLAEPKWFKTVFVFSGIWQNTGWNAIIYLAALAGINPELHEAAIVDGAKKIQRIIHIDVPGILPTAVILLILNMGRIMNVNFQKVLLLQNYLNLESSEVIKTYVYKIGLLNAQYGYSTAIGLFNNLINLTLVLTVNRIAKSLGRTSLW